MGWSREILGRSHEGREILGYSLPAQPGDKAPYPRPGGCLIIGGTHGDERATVALLETFRDNHPEGENFVADVYLLPCLNPDGFAKNQRYNHRQVDLNRNFETGWKRDSEQPAGAHPLSEIESRILQRLVLSLKPQCIVSLHWALAELDADGNQSLEWVQAMWSALNSEEQSVYRWRHSASESDLAEQGPPGSFGRWAGHALRYDQGGRPAMITLELPYTPFFQPRPATLPLDHFEQMQRYWDTHRAEYMDYVYPGVARMLHTVIRKAGRPE